MSARRNDLGGDLADRAGDDDFVLERAILRIRADAIDETGPRLAGEAAADFAAIEKLELRSAGDGAGDHDVEALVLGEESFGVEALAFPEGHGAGGVANETVVCPIVEAELGGRFVPLGILVCGMGKMPRPTAYLPTWPFIRGIKAEVRFEGTDLLEDDAAIARVEFAAGGERETNCAARGRIVRGVVAEPR
jgi:hypothetical protein